MRVYVDSSALIKRVVIETESTALVDELDRYDSERALIVSSSLAWIEVARAIRNRRNADLAQVADSVDGAMAGIAEHPISSEVVSLSRRLGPNCLRSLDAIHLASALLVDADVMLTYDDRLAAACREAGVRVAAPGC